MGALESLHAIQTGELREFSEQAIVDCSNDGTYGCNGGWPKYAIDWVAENGIPYEEDYKYKGHNSSCKSFDSQFSISESVSVTTYSSSALA